MTLPEQTAKALPVKVAKALENLMTAAQEAQQEFIEAAARERALPQTTSECVWVSATGKEMYIGDMHDHHVRNALAMVANRLREGKVAYMNEQGRITFAERLQHVVDGKDTFIDDGGNINNF